MCSTVVVTRVRWMADDTEDVLKGTLDML